MKKSFIIFFCVMVIGIVWLYILEIIFGLNLNQLRHDNGILYFFLMSPVFIFMLFCCVYFDLGDDSEETPKEKTKTENLKTDNPENDEIITVTEIQGERKIIKNGKVIYSEKLKADELKVFENLKDKN